MPRSVGSVSVSVVPDATDFVPKARAQLEPGARDIGDALGRAIGASMVDSLSPYLDEIRAKLDLLGTKDINIKVKVDDNGSLARTEAELGAVDAAAASGGGGFDIFGSKILNIGALAVAAADVAIPALLAIGAAAAGLLAGAGVLALGASGIGAALEAHDKQASGGGGSSSALGLQSAQINAAQATRSAQDQLTQAIQSQAKAEQGLHDARVQALQDLQDLDNKLKDNTLSQQQASINLDQAKAALAVTLAAPGAGLAQYADQVSQARLNVALAQQKANELALSGSRLSADDKTAHQQGVAGNPNVVAAQQTLVDANHKLVEAQANIGITAQKNAIALAQAGAAAAGAAGGVNSFANAMAKLNPLQQQFVEFLLTLKPLFDELKAAASEFLPGLEQGIKNALPAFQPILTVVGAVARAMGTVFAEIGAQFSTGQGRQFLQFLAVELPKQIIFLGNLFIDFGKIVSGIFEAAAPLIDAFDNALLGSLTATGKAANGSGLRQFFASLIPLIRPAFQVIGAIGGAISAILRAIAPLLPPVLNVITEVADEIAILVSGPVGQELVQLFLDLINALTPLIPLFVQILQAILPPLISFIDTLVKSALAPLVQAISTALTPILPILGKALSDLVAALAPFLAQLIQGLLPVLPPLSKLFIDVLNSLTPLIKPFGDLLSAVAPLVKPIADILVLFLQLIDDVLPILTPLIKGLGTVMGGIATVIGTVVNVLKDMIDAMKTVINLIPSLPGFTETVKGKGSVSFSGSAPFEGSASHRAGGGPVIAGETYRWREFGDEMFVPKVDGTIINAIQTGQLVKALTNGAGGKGSNYFAVYGQSDPVSTSHMVANRLAGRRV